MGRFWLIFEFKTGVLPTRKLSSSTSSHINFYPYFCLLCPTIIFTSLKYLHFSCLPKFYNPAYVDVLFDTFDLSDKVMERVELH